MKYFMAFDFFNDDINKYCSDIFDINLNTESMIDVARKEIEKILPYCNVNSFSIKIISFNNVEVDKPDE